LKAEGFAYSSKLGPSILFKPKKWQPKVVHSSNSIGETEKEFKTLRATIEKGLV
jgi:hypothetical protein